MVSLVVIFKVSLQTSNHEVQDKYMAEILKMSTIYGKGYQDASRCYT